MIRFASYNVMDLYKYEQDADELARYDRVYQVIREFDADVIAIQELIAEDPDKGTKAADRLERLAEAVDRQCFHAPLRAAVALGTHRFHVALLWRDGIEPVGGWGAYGSGNFWHSVAQLTFDVGGPKVRHGSFHARPFGRQSRADEAERLAHVVNRPASRPAGLIGGDWNCLSADWIADDGSVPRHDGTEPQQQMRYYDPDPWTEQPWHGDFAFQCDWGYEPSGRRWHRADRRPADILYASGLADAAAALAAPWENTCGHWNSGADPLGARRLDRILVTHEVRPALVRYEVVRTELAKSASDHLPVIVEYDPDLLGD